MRHPGPTSTLAPIALGGLGITVIAVLVVAVGVGQVAIPPDEVLGSILRRIGLDGVLPVPSHPQGENALWQVRFPRVLMGVVVGAALGCAGALMQGVFGNPLAEPGVIGVSAGAAVGASAVIVLGVAASTWPVAGAAFATGLVTSLLVYVLARGQGRTEVVTLVLTGVAINAFAGGLIAFFTFAADPAAREQIVFWQLGTLNGTTWPAVGVAAAIAVPASAAAWWLGRQLDLLALGERAARHLGIDVERLRLGSIVLVALLVASGVAFTGIVVFIGLVVPHLVRMALGPAHRTLIPASALLGAVVLVLADLVARTAISNADLPLGMLTALVGGPFFLWLLRRTRSSQGGWA